jgi:uncharacterized BrkB/YihY/UPF0761 family membrane protein
MSTAENDEDNRDSDPGREEADGFRQSVIGIVRFAIRTENTAAGRVNLVGMCLAVLASGLLGVTGLIEPIVRIWSRSYRSGISPISLLIVLIVFFLFCVLIVGLLDRARGSGDRH